MARIKNVDVLGGKLLPSIVKFGVPLLLVALIQSLFSSVDMMVLGQFANDDAVAAVAATATFVQLLVTLSFGISGGAKVVLARLIGEGAGDKSKQTVFTSIVTAVMLGFITMAIGIFLAPVFLNLTECPANISGDAMIYMSIYFAAAPAIMLYNFGVNIIQVSGDSQRPLYYMMISGGLNVVLNFILCLILPNKVSAVAIATAISQTVGAVLVLRRILTLDGVCRLYIRGMRFNWHSFKLLMANGLPIGLTTSLYSIANLQIQTAINSFGTESMAGNSAAVNYEGVICSLTYSPWVSTVNVFAAQNIGADNKKRVADSIRICLAFSMTLAAVLGIAVMLFSKPLLLVFVDSAEAVRYGQIRILYTLLPYTLQCLQGVLANAIVAFGYSIFNTVNSILSVFVFRIVWMNFIYPLYPTFPVLMQCFLVSTLLIVIINLIFFFYLYYGKFKANKIKKMG